MPHLAQSFAELADLVGALLSRDLPGLVAEDGRAEERRRKYPCMHTQHVATVLEKIQPIDLSGSGPSTGVLPAVASMDKTSLKSLAKKFRALGYLG